MFAIRKNVNTTGFKYRVKVRAFKTSDAMHGFLNKQSNNDWSVMANPVKSGTYVERGIECELLNVKSIDPSALAHM